MINKKELKKRLQEAKSKFREKKRIPLADISYGVDEVLEIINCLVSTEVTMGKNVEKFEKVFADYISVKHAIMVNRKFVSSLYLV